jgi:hypothetical protein
MEDADQPVGQLAQGGMVADAAGGELVIGAGARGGRQNLATTGSGPSGFSTLGRAVAGALPPRSMSCLLSRHRGMLRDPKLRQHNNSSMIRSPHVRRMGLAVNEALIGQLYLVTVVALLVGNIGRCRIRSDQG